MASSLRKSLEEQVTCAICHEHYRDPRLLPCLHTYCKQCLDNLVRASRNKGQVTCPECREVVQMGPSGTDQFKVHFQMNNLMSLLTISTPETQTGMLPCDNCTSKDPAKGRCSDCGVLLCDFCLNAHRRFKETQDHKIMTLEEVKEQGVPAMTQQIKCEKHKGEVKKLYCESCEQLICRDCTIIDHRDHKFQFIDEVAGSLIENLRSDVQRAHQAKSEVEKKMNLVKEIKAKINTNRDNTLKEIEDAVQKQIAVLRKKEQSLKEEVQRFADERMKRLDKKEDMLSKTLNGFDNSILFAQKILQDGNNVNTLSVLSDVRSRLYALTDVRNVENNYEKERTGKYHDIGLVVDYENLEKSVQNGMHTTIPRGENVFVVEDWDQDYSEDLSKEFGQDWSEQPYSWGWSEHCSRAVPENKTKKRYRKRSGKYEQ